MNRQTGVGEEIKSNKRVNGLNEKERKPTCECEEGESDLPVFVFFMLRGPSTHVEAIRRRRGAQ